MSSLIKEILKNKNKISFHTPAHNNTLPKQFLQCDITELCYSDNLLNPTGVIKKIEDNISKIYNAERAFISTNGATNCILTAIYSLKDKGSFLVVGKDTHKSVYNALNIFACSAYYIASLIDFEETTLPEDIRTIVVTTPNYYGECINLAFYQSFAKRNDCYLIIDSSHGSHFIFHKKLPDCASRYGDLVIFSFHKTLPVPTGGAALVCNNKNIINRCIKARALLHSTSPSYIVLSGIERAINIMQREGKKLYDKVYCAIEEFRKCDLGNFRCTTNDDFSRLVIYSGINGRIVMRHLFDRGIVLEMSNANRVIAIVTPYNYKYLKKLARELRRISSLNITETKALNKQDIENMGLTKIDFDTKSEWIALSEALNRISAKPVGLYPPGTPILRCGTTITKQAIREIEENADRAFGLENGKVCVLLYDSNGG